MLTAPRPHRPLALARLALASVALAALAALCTACAAELPADEPTVDSEDAVRGSNCEATFVWLQKDAYKETAGRTSPAWPPHTTTTLDAYCTTKAAGRQKIGGAFQANYGTEPGAVDKNGKVFLVEVKREAVRGSKDAMLRLLDAYKTCGCNPDKFLSMDKLKGDVGNQLLADVVKTIENNTKLACTAAGGKAALVAALKASDFEKAIAIVPTCTFDGGDLGSTLDQAMAEVAKGTQKTLADYHVCNNNAALQTALLEGFKTKGDIVACSATSPLCSGPKWLYNP